MVTRYEITKIINRIVSNANVPSSVYRLQFNGSFRFENAMEYINYFVALGVDGIYSSPLFEAVPGSPHGYNITDSNSINPEIGSNDDFNRFITALKENGLKHIIDIVPNHMGIKGGNNLLWQDILENGRWAKYGHFFDIDWDSTKIDLKNRLLLPVLGDQFGAVLENGELQILYNEGKLFLSYWGNLFPIAPETYHFVLDYNKKEWKEHYDKDDLEFAEYLSIIRSFRNTPTANEMEERYREKDISKQRLHQLVERSDKIRDIVLHNLHKINGEKGDSSSFNLLEELLNAQHYRIASWHVASEEINYRRFFDINDLAAIRIEDKTVFSFHHRLIFELLKTGKVDGLRIDHSDGLYDPIGYFKNLQHRYLYELVEKELLNEYGELQEHDYELIETAIDDYPLDEKLPLFVVIEKILDRKEDLPEDWAVSGTVGYEFLNALNGIFICRQHEEKFEDIYVKVTEKKEDFEELLYRKKLYFSKVKMPGEINMLSRKLKKISTQCRMHRDYTLNNLKTAIEEIIASFPVYRTYITPDADSVSERDSRYINIAIEKARHRDTRVAGIIFDFIRDVLTLNLKEPLTPTIQADIKGFVLSFQQISSPIMAKGVEDTAFYINNRFISLNEVGSDPEYFGYSLPEFHKQNSDRLKYWPHGFVTGSTHDTKRSEDVRMRMNVISEMPDDWLLSIKRWIRINKKFKVEVDGVLQPERNTEYFIYQTLIGVWPDYPMKPAEYEKFINRIELYLQKSVREAKTYTNWVLPNEQYEKAVDGFIRDILRRKRNYFLKIFREFQGIISNFGMLNSLSALVLRLGVPGIVDIYQGSEVWNYSLVDPDNRKKVDFSLRRHLFYRTEHQLQSSSQESVYRELMSSKKDSRIKIYALSKGLLARKNDKELFLQGSYQYLEVEGEYANHIVAYYRKYEDRVAIVLVGRFFSRLCKDVSILPLGMQVWKDTRLLLPSEISDLEYSDIYTDRKFSANQNGIGVNILVGDIFEFFSFSILVGKNSK